MATNRSVDRKSEEVLEQAFATAGVVCIVLFGYPQILGVLPGGLVAGFCPSRFDDQADRAWWRSTAGWSIGAGLAVAAAYFALDSVIGADVEWRRFNRQWGLGHLDPAALVAHPWAWLPLGAALALIAAGAGILWRTR